MKIGAGLFRVSPSGIHERVGEVTMTDTTAALLIRLRLWTVAPGPHGLHVHEGCSCAPGPNKDGKIIAAGGAGGHYDPERTGRHLGPYRRGHLGDLPRVVVPATGTVDTFLYAPRPRARDFAGRVLIVHAGGDNYSDQPKPLGGGGERIACGVLWW